jgi:hypothetical protein
MPNDRIYFACHAGAIKGDNTSYQFGIDDMIHGLQTIGMTTNFNLTPITVIGQLETYEMKEELPDVQVTLSKVLDGYPLLFHKATVDAESPTLGGRSKAKCIFGLAIYPDTNDAAEGTADSVLACSGMFVNSASYTFTNTSDPFTEEISLVGNNRVWKNASGYGYALNPNLPSPDFDDPTAFDGNDDEPIGLGGVNSRENMLFETSVVSGDNNNMIADPDCTILPPEVFGVNISGVNILNDAGHARLAGITVSVDFNREEINELGRRGPYSRTVAFPIDVTCEIETTSHSGDMISATEEGIYTTGEGCSAAMGNLKHRTIRIATCEGTRIYLGVKNKLSATNHSGGDAGGGNVSTSYTFTNQNSLTILHSGDPHVSGDAWWANRAHWLIN